MSGSRQGGRSLRKEGVTASAAVGALAVVRALLLAVLLLTSALAHGDLLGTLTSDLHRPTPVEYVGHWGMMTA